MTVVQMEFPTTLVLVGADHTSNAKLKCLLGRLFRLSFSYVGINFSLIPTISNRYRCKTKNHREKTHQIFKKGASESMPENTKLEKI